MALTPPPSSLLTSTCFSCYKCTRLQAVPSPPTDLRYGAPRLPSKTPCVAASARICRKTSVHRKSWSFWIRRRWWNQLVISLSPDSLMWVIVLWVQSFRWLDLTFRCTDWNHHLVWTMEDSMANLDSISAWRFCQTERSWVQSQA